MKRSVDEVPMQSGQTETRQAYCVQADIASVLKYAVVKPIYSIRNIWIWSLLLFILLLLFHINKLVDVYCTDQEKRANHSQILAGAE